MIDETELAEMRANVERGIAYLDKNETGWRDTIGDLGWEFLDMGDCERCIFGGLYEHYDAGIALLELDRSKAAHLGFVSSDNWLHSGEYSEYYAALTELWQELGPKKADE